MAKKEVAKTDEYLTGSIDLSQDSLLQAIREIERKILRLLRGIETTSQGTIVKSKTTLATLTKMHGELVLLFKDPYNKEVRNHVRRYRGISSLVKDTFKDIGASAVEFAAVDQEALQQVGNLDYGLLKDIGKEAQRRITKAAYASSMSGGSIEDLEIEIEGILTGHKDIKGRSLSLNSRTIAQDQIMQFHATANRALGEQNDVQNWWYVGDVIETSREFCEVHAGETKTTQEWNDIGRNQDWAGKSCSDIFVCRGGYNCRHHFQAVMA